MFGKATSIHIAPKWEKFSTIAPKTYQSEAVTFFDIPFWGVGSTLNILEQIACNVSFLIKSKPKTEVLSPQKMVNIRCWIRSLHSISNNRIIEEMSNLQTKSPLYCSMFTHQHISIMNESAGFGGTRSVNITRWCYFSLSPSFSRPLSLANIANATLTHTHTRALLAHANTHTCLCV